MSKSKELRIYLVDDDQFYLNIMKQITINLGYKDVSIFKNGDSCLSQINKKPDVIFLDYQMDTLNGFEVLNKIKRYDPNIYVVMVSGQGDGSKVNEFMEHGAFDYLQKNVNNEQDMKNTLEKIIKLKALKNNSISNFLKSIFNYYK